MTSTVKGRWLQALEGTETPDRSVIGGKAWSIARIGALGLKVPPAIVIKSAASVEYLQAGHMPDGLVEELASGMRWLESRSQRSFGGTERPLLVSIRSGAAISMPGMMDTVLNLGINAETEVALARETGLPEFARDTRRRFYELYASIVLKEPVELDPAVAPEEWESQLGGRLPTSLEARLVSAVQAVFDSWNSRRARRYRQHNNIPDDIGTAVTIQAMVFGNLDELSGTGVLFSRNPLTGERQPFGEYLPRAQGEDVVSGKVTPLPLSAMAASVPEAHAALLAASAALEADGCDVQDIEFTVQSGELYLLQARSAKRSPEAAVQFAVDMVDEGLIDEATALGRVSADQVRVLLHPRLRSAEGAELLMEGEGACPGVASGILVADSDEAERRAAAGEKVILVRSTTSPDDVHGMIAARGIITEQGGATSHAAVVSRALGRPCVVGCGAGAVARAGQTVTVDGGTGRVYAGTLDTIEPDEAGDPRLARLIDWARKRSRISVLRPSEASDPPTDLVDLDVSPAGLDIAGLAALLDGHKSVRGAAFADPGMADVALSAGVDYIVTEPVLPALLRSLEIAE